MLAYLGLELLLVPFEALNKLNSDEVLLFQQLVLLLDG